MSGTRTFVLFFIWDGAGAVRLQWCWNQPQWTRKWFCLPHVSGTVVNIKAVHFNAFYRRKETLRARHRTRFTRNHSSANVSVHSDHKRVGLIRTDVGKFTHRLRDPVMPCSVISSIPTMRNDHNNTLFSQKCYYIYRLHSILPLPSRRTNAPCRFTSNVHDVCLSQSMPLTLFFLVKVKLLAGTDKPLMVARGNFTTLHFLWTVCEVYWPLMSFICRILWTDRLDSTAYAMQSLLFSLY